MAEFDPKLIGKGFKAGVGSANVNNHADAKARTCYLLGAFANYPITKNIDFQIELNAVEKGYIVNDTPIVDTLGNVIGSAEWRALVTYVEIPVMVKFTLPLRGKVKPYLNIGAFVAQTILKKERRTSDSSGLAYEINLEGVKSNDAGFVFAAGVDLKSGNGFVFLEARYDYSNISMLKNTKFRSRVWMFQVGYWW